MKRIALITAALGLGWITLAGAMETDSFLVPEKRYVDGKSTLTPTFGGSRPQPSPPTLSDIGPKNKATPLRRSDTYSNPTKNNRNDRNKIYNPITIPLW